MNIGKEGKAFVAEPIPEPRIIEAPEEVDAPDEVLVPVAAFTDQPVEVTA